MSHKASSRHYAGPGFVQRLARKLQASHRITFATAVVRARALLGVPEPVVEALPPAEPPAEPPVEE